MYHDHGLTSPRLQRPSKYLLLCIPLSAVLIGLHPYGTRHQGTHYEGSFWQISSLVDLYTCESFHTNPCALVAWRVCPSLNSKTWQSWSMTLIPLEGIGWEVWVFLINWVRQTAQGIKRINRAADSSRSRYSQCYARGLCQPAWNHASRKSYNDNHEHFQRLSGGARWVSPKLQSTSRML